jgi:hypothetical protein
LRRALGSGKSKVLSFRGSFWHAAETAFIDTRRSALVKENRHYGDRVVLKGSCKRANLRLAEDLIKVNYAAYAAEHSA